MLVLSKPPYLRWIAAVLLVGAALGWDVSRRATEMTPFAARTINRGEIIQADAIVWKPAPVGLLRSGDVPPGSALITISAGEPITADMISTGGNVPDGWWTVPMEIPPTVTQGSQVRVVLADGSGLTGIVVEPSHDDTFGVRSLGLVAVPGDVADVVAMAAATGQLVVLFKP